jgi:hypothetical protein
MQWEIARYCLAHGKTDQNDPELKTGSIAGYKAVWPHRIWEKILAKT